MGARSASRALLPNPRFPLVVALFLVSGATGLLYEVSFSKTLATIFGATAYAVSTVLAAFMGGLALGAHLGGRYAARVRRPLAAYGALEILVGVICATTPAAFEWLTRAYVAVARAAPDSLATLTVARAALTGLIVVIPTVAMGTTLPLLSRVVAGEGPAGAGAADGIGGGPRRLAILYAINTTGGALGALSGAYAFLPAFGIRGTMYAAALTNGVIGVIALIAGSRRALPAAETETVSNGVPAPESPEAPGAGTAPAMPDAAPTISEVPSASASPSKLGGEGLFTVLAFVSGFLVFAAEVVEVHLLALLIGNSAYAFGLMLAVFLVCLGIGAARAPAFAARHGAAAIPRGLAYAALSIAVTLPLWDQLPRVFAAAGKVVHSWGGREICRAVIALAILVIPTVWMGTTFPLLLQRIAARADVAARVGRLTVASTLGTIAGSIATGYVVLPALGSQRALGAVAACFAVASVVAARRELRGSPEPARILALGLASIVLAFALPRWDLARLTSGANVYFTYGPPPDRIEFVREDVHGGVTTVTRQDQVTTLYTNGKFQGDDGAEMAAQRRFAHFPSLFVHQPRSALVIGLGTGTTLGTIATYPYERVVVAEISPSIVEASRQFFAGPSLDALDDPRVRLELNDGRNVLLVATEPFDLIAIELTSVWFAGASSLYSHEFYELVRARLTDGGVLQQWVQLHHIRRRELAAIVRTLRGVFPHVALFVGGSQGILVASGEPLVASAAHLKAMSERPALRETLGGLELPAMLDEIVASGPELDRYVRDAEADGGPILSTDDNLYLEYATPKGNVLEYAASLASTLDSLKPYRTPNVRERHLGP